MRKIKFAALVLLALCTAAGAWAQGGTEKLSVALTKPGQAYELTVSMINGSINVQSYDGNEIQVESMGGRANSPEIVNGMRRIGGGSLSNIIAEVSNNKVKIHTGMPGGISVLNVKVPQSLSSLKLVTVNGGNLGVNDVSGEIEVTNTNGSIRLTNVSGSVVATTVNGSIAVGFKSVDPKAAMAFTTLNGNVDVTLPATLKATVKAKTDQGSISTDFDMKATAGKVVSSEASNGMMKFKSDNWLYGTINGGGQEILFKTLNGSIFIRKAK